MKTNPLLILVVAGLYAASPACASNAIFTPEPTPSLPLQDVAPIQPTETPLASAEPSPTRTVADTSLAPDGPWWVIETHENGIWAVNRDGTGLTQLGIRSIHPFYEIRDGVAPQGGHLVYITGRDNYFELALNILSLPSGETEAVIPLTTDDTEPGPEALHGDPPFEAARSIVEANSIAWSPDGRQLAFMGMMEGPSSDLYLYSLDDGSIARLTDGLSQGIRPIWSPDGQYIVHVGVAGMGTGAGLSVQAVWTAEADGSAVKMLYEPRSGDEVVVGWIGADTFVVYSWQIDCGQTNLRTVHAESGAERVLWEGFFDHVSLDSNSGSLIFAVSESVAECNPGGQQGLFHVGTEGAPAWRIVEDEVSRLVWSPEASLFLARTEHGVLAVSPEGDFIDLATPPLFSGLPVAAPGTRELAWIGPEMWISSLTSSIEQPPRQVFSEEAASAAWGPDGRYLLFFSRAGLNVAQGPDFSPVLVADGLTARSTAWVQP